MKNKKSIAFSWLSFGALVVAIVLEALPYGAVIILHPNPEAERIIKLYSYFSFTPLGNANFPPFVTAVLTVILAIVSFVLLFVKNKSSKLDTMLLALTITTIIVSICPILYGLDFYSITGICVTFALVASAILNVVAKMIAQNAKAAQNSENSTH